MVAQTPTDGFMLEPSRKQRRAEALYKYKQKRKVNLNAPTNWKF